MAFLRDKPIRTKLTLLLIGIVSFALVLICLAFLIHDVRLAKRAMVERLNALAYVLGNDCRDHLAFAELDIEGAQQDVKDTLASLRLEPTVVAAGIYDREGRLFATYVSGRGPERKLPTVSSPDGHAFYDDSLNLTLPILLGEERLGSIFLSESTRGLETKLRDDIIMAIAVFVICMGLVALLASRLQRFISDPIQRLAAATREVSDAADYSIRVDSQTKDEIGVLIDGFNEMLAQIQFRDRQLEAANHQLKEKNEELEQFIYTVSHDLKSPLVTCQGFVSLLQKDLDAGNLEQIEDSATRIQKATRRMAQLIEDLLKLSRIGRMPMDPRRVDMDELLLDIAEELKWQLDDSRTELVIQQNLPDVTADPLRLRQVLDNLITNALKYGRREEGCRISVGYQEAGANSHYFVADNGPGIAPEYHERIFRVFERLEKGGEGTGIGLAIVARIMKRLGGNVWVDSRLGEGARFCLRFPKTPPRPAAASWPEEPLQTPAG